MAPTVCNDASCMVCLLVLSRILVSTGRSELYTGTPVEEDNLMRLFLETKLCAADI
jgi:hypothetical protein